MRVIVGPRFGSRNIFTDDCFFKALRRHKCKLERESGPHWALHDGNRLLKPIGKELVHVVDTDFLSASNKYILHWRDHFLAVRTFDNDFYLLDGEECH